MIEKLDFTVPLSLKAHQIAEQYRRQQIDPQQAKRVYLNTLAIYAVNHYLNCLGWQTDWPASDSWNPVALRVMDVADLVVRQLGRVECRPVLPGADSMAIPPEVWQDRVAYIAVQLNPSLQQADILGFVPTPTRMVALKDLQPLEDLIPYLGGLTRPEVSLLQWLEGEIEQGWQTIETLLRPDQLQLALNFRHGGAPSHDAIVVRSQRIDLGMQVDRRSVALVLTASSLQDAEMDICVQVYPIEQVYLPSGLQLVITDDSGYSLEADAKEVDNCIQQEFSATIGERFQVTITLGQDTIIRDFAL